VRHLGFPGKFIGLVRPDHPNDRGKLATYAAHAECPPLKLHALKLLLADDNPQLRSIIRTILGGIGITQVQQCADGASALNLLRQWPADIAIVDYEMSPIDGLAFTYLVRNSPDSPNRFLPVIMITAHADLRRVCEARDAGVTELLVKPITAGGVVDRLNAVIFRPRPFIESANYVGPCRRRRRDASYAGPLRRAADSALAGLMARL
jgi:CheY-like chemotaxis protein